MNEDNALTKEQAESLYQSNRSALTVAFHSYYKYSFTFSGETDQITLSLTYGGDPNDIYRYSVSTEPRALPDTLAQLHDTYHGITLTDKRSGNKYQHYDY